MIIDEINRLAEELEVYSSIYKTFWSQIYVTESENVPTAGISFSNIGEPLTMMVNPVFWKKLPVDEKKFIIIHECMHVLFLHGVRSTVLGSKQNLDYRALNIAMDIAINHYIDQNIGFSRDLIDWKKYCYVETIFSNKQVPTNETFKYYYELIIKNSQQHSGGQGRLVDDHGHIRDFFEKTSKEVDQAVGNIAKNALGSDPDKKESIDKAIDKNWGTGVSSNSVDVFVKAVNQKYWNKLLIKNKLTQKKSLIQDIDFTESWIKESRRTGCLDNSFMLPREVDDIVEVTPLHLRMYIDVSGSCAHFVKPFTELIKSVPKNKFKFDAFGFCTVIHNLNFRDKIVKIPYGGGTSFNCIVKHVNAEQRKPDAIVVVTDGYACFTEKNVSVPERYSWFMTSGHTMNDIRNHPAFRDYKGEVVLPPYHA